MFPANESQSEVSTGPVDKVRQILDGFRHNGLGYLDYLQSEPAASDEAVVRQKIVEPLLAALGYDLQADLDPEHREGDNAIDILVRADGIPVMLWELKRTQEADLPRHENKLSRYVLAEAVTHGMLCNGREVRVYQRVGESVEFIYGFPLSAFGAGTTAPRTPEEELALEAFFDAYNKDAFCEVERRKQDIIATEAPPLALRADQPENEARLISDLRREIARLHRFVVLRFRSHQERYDSFVEGERHLRDRIEDERGRLTRWIDRFEDQTKLHTERTALEEYLQTFRNHWSETEEDAFVDTALNRLGVVQHLTVARRTNLEIRLREIYRAVTEHGRWQAQQRVELRAVRELIDSFDHWREEIGVMAEDPQSEFCLQTVYIFVTRLLLIRICEDKELIAQKISDGGYKDYLEFSSYFFSNIVDAHGTLLNLAYKDTSYIYGHFFTDGIFDWIAWDEETIVRLFWTLNHFDFEDISADLIGRIYEQYVDELERRRKGQFYTPPQVIEYILDQVEYNGSSVIGKSVLDPACGSGRFLVEAARRLIRVLKRETNLAPKQLVNERLRNTLFGLDVNRFACFLAEVNLLVQVLDLVKEYPEFTIERFHIYPTNTLIPEKQRGAFENGPVNGVFEEREVAELIKQGGSDPALGLDLNRGFDWVVGNPPYVKADHPEAGSLRLKIEATGEYETLHKKWDLYIPFIEFAVSRVAEGGWHSFIVSDAYQTEDYGSLSRQLLLEETTIERLTFAPDVSFFEDASVHNLIYAVRKDAPSDEHEVERYKAVEPTLDEQDLEPMPSLRQIKWREQVFRPGFEGEPFDFEGCIKLKEICFVVRGLEAQSHENYDPVIEGERVKLFTKDDLISETKTDDHIKRYVEGSDLGRLYLRDRHWLEWDTERVPSKLRRDRIPALFAKPKILVGITSGDVYPDESGTYYTNHSINLVVPYDGLDEDEAKAVARSLSRWTPDSVLEELAAVYPRASKSELLERLVERRAEKAGQYDLGYVTALLSTRWLFSEFMRLESRDQMDLYPNDLKEWPIAPADAQTQSQMAELIRETVAAKQDINRWRKRGHRIDQDAVVVNPRPLLEAWGLDHCDLIDCQEFLSYDINGHITGVERDGDRVIFRKRPLSYIQSEHECVLEYLELYLETNRESLNAENVASLANEIRMPRSPDAVRGFLDSLLVERNRMMRTSMFASQRENLVDEWAFDLYGVAEGKREKLSGRRYSLEGVPKDVNLVSILSSAEGSPLQHVAFRKDGYWQYRTSEEFPRNVAVWTYDERGRTVLHRCVCAENVIVIRML